MKKYIYISLLFLTGCVTCPECPPTSEANQRQLEKLMEKEIQLSEKEFKLKKDSVRLDSFKIEFLKVVKSQQETQAYIIDKYNKDSVLVDTLRKIRDQIQSTQNISGNLTIKAEPGVNVETGFDSITGKPKLIMK